MFEDYFERKLISHRESIRHKKSLFEPFITISRETGAGNIDFSEILLDYLNKNDFRKNHEWKIFDKNLIEQIIIDLDLPSEMAKYIPERKISEIQDVLEQLFALHPSEQSLIRKASSTILHLALLGNVILIGRGSNFITKDLRGGLHLRLIDSVETKIKNIQQSLSLSRSEALKFIRKEDKEKKQYSKKYFSGNIESPYSYSLILNFGFLSAEDAVNIAGDAIIKMRNNFSGYESKAS
jgi:cytidylate kinase